ncbi:MAG: hypothetical protein IT193_07895 [Propionibacteriaceae bacterium]|nr:hypothetical protein [Propionibacteriaceae bacterium]
MARVAELLGIATAETARKLVRHDNDGVTSPKARRCWRHDGVRGTGPWGTPLTWTPQAPQNPFAAVGLVRDRLAARRDDPVVEQVDHVEQRLGRREVLELVAFPAS